MLLCTKSTTVTSRPPQIAHWYTGGRSRRL
jgi:hypothetical protein